MAMAMATGRGQRADINMTPMIDVLLVLIIIFMVITPLAPRGLQALVPQQQEERGGETGEARGIVVTVRGDGTALLNQEAMSLDALGERLLQLYKNGAAQAVFLRGEKGLEFAHVAEVLDLVHAAGVANVGLMTN